MWKLWVVIANQLSMHFPDWRVLYREPHEGWPGAMIATCRDIDYHKEWKEIINTDCSFGKDYTSEDYWEDVIKEVQEIYIVIRI